MKLIGTKKPCPTTNLNKVICANTGILTMNNLTQNFVNPNNQSLVIGNFTIRQDQNGRYCLHDLHKASGGFDKHQPAFFIRNKQTKDLIAEIETENHSANLQSAIEVINGGNQRGTYVVKELVYAYAMWISAKFHLTVIRAYDAMVMQWKINDRQTISPEQQALLHEIVARRSGGERKIYAEMWSRHNRHFKIPRYAELLAIHFSESIHYLETMELKSKVINEKLEQKNVFELLASDTTSKVMDYYYMLHQEIKRLGGNTPKYPDFDEETIVRASVTRMIQGGRMMLHVGYDGKPSISLIPNDSWILNGENIVGIIGDPSGPKEELLPKIIQAAANRLSK